MYPTLFTTPGIKAFAEEIDAERQRQLAKFGEQHHRDGTSPDRVWTFTGPAAYVATCVREHVDYLAEEGHSTWLDIALEEFAEAAAESDPAKLRAELVQVAAVCAAWIADIDSRTPAAEEPAACAKCRQPFVPAVTGFEENAQYAATPHCRGCVDRCHSTEIADHRCVICA